MGQGECEQGNSVHDVSGGGAVGRREDDDGAGASAAGGTESFYRRVYDAMKVKKRFEHMRVGFILFFVSSSFRSPVVSSSFPFL